MKFHEVADVDLLKIQQCMRAIIVLNGKRLFKLRITDCEILLSLKHGPEGFLPFRFVISSNSGFFIDLNAYKEVVQGNSTVLMSFSEPFGLLHLTEADAAYELNEDVQPKRYRAHLMGTSYIYDFPEIFNGALKGEWKEPPAKLINCHELIINSKGELERCRRAPGNNICGMVAWEMELFTPQYPSGRSIIVIGNDITFNIGSFGPMEDLVFLRASQMARRLGIPRVYISANSGARIGLADEVSDIFKIAWIDSKDPTKGFEYLYIEEDDFLRLNLVSPTVEAERIFHHEIVRYKLTCIIGSQDGIGVENLKCSGEISGETSKAYREIFTLSLVTCRSVGKL